MRKFIRIDEVKEGDTLIADAGFTCLIRGKKYIVHNDRNAPSGLHILCMDGKHYLVGQMDRTDTHYIGLYKED